MAGISTDTIGRYLRSSAVTFVATFVAVILLNWESLGIDAFVAGTATAIILVAVRAGVKAVLEQVLGWTRK